MPCGFVPNERCGEFLDETLKGWYNECRQAARPASETLCSSSTAALDTATLPTEWLRKEWNR